MTQFIVDALCRPDNPTTILPPESSPTEMDCNIDSFDGETTSVATRVIVLPISDASHCDLFFSIVSSFTRPGNLNGLSVGIKVAKQVFLSIVSICISLNSSGHPHYMIISTPPPNT